MEDKQIIGLFFDRDENAIVQSREKYGEYCRYTAYRILENNEDAEECVNDALLKAWNAIPPEKPEKLSAFLCRITRNLALNLYAVKHAAKRGGNADAVFEELEGCLPDSAGGRIAEDTELKDALDTFLKSLPRETAVIFMRRYWYMSTVKEISRDHGISESKVKMSLMRTRNKLKAYLESEGIEI